jgi:hypothetical protein
MSVAKLLLSGLLAASGLLLGAFTLHGYFDPQWAVQQMQAGAREPVLEAKSVNALDGGGFKATVHPAGTGASQPPVKAGAKADAKPPGAEADAKAADEKARKPPIARKLAEKRRAEQAQKAEKAKQPPQQTTTFQWPWNWLD